MSLALRTIGTPYRKIEKYSIQDHNEDRQLSYKQEPHTFISLTRIQTSSTLRFQNPISPKIETLERPQCNYTSLLWNQTILLLIVQQCLLSIIVI